MMTFFAARGVTGRIDRHGPAGLSQNQERGRKSILAIAAAAAAITAGASAANAQSCDHGIVMHGNVPTTCGGANGAGAESRDLLWQSS